MLPVLGIKPSTDRLFFGFKFFRNSSIRKVHLLYQSVGILAVYGRIKVKCYGMDQKNQNDNPASSTVRSHHGAPVHPVTTPPAATPVLPLPVAKKPKRFQFRGFLSTLALIAGALIFATLINQFMLQSYKVDGSSMEPSLQNGDRLIIWKLPRTWAKITGQDYVPQRGDIVVFHKPDGSKEELIKRVIGLPGDHVVVSDGEITVFNRSQPTGFKPDDAPYGDILSQTAGNVDVMVGEGEIFVSGDNRIPGASFDSRSSLGNIDLDLVVGKLVLRLFPVQNFDLF